MLHQNFTQNSEEISLYLPNNFFLVKVCVIKILIFRLFTKVFSFKRLREVNFIVPLSKERKKIQLHKQINNETNPDSPSKPFLLYGNTQSLRNMFDKHNNSMWSKKRLTLSNFAAILMAPLAPWFRSVASAYYLIIRRFFWKGTCVVKNSKKFWSWFLKN